MHGECRLQLNLIDRHRTAPPKVRVEVNGQGFERSLPPGRATPRFTATRARGRRPSSAFTFSAKVLKTGDNEVRITTLSGSWMLYDSLALTVPAGAELGAGAIPNAAR